MAIMPFLCRGVFTKIIISKNYKLGRIFFPIFYFSFYQKTILFKIRVNHTVQSSAFKSKNLKFTRLALIIPKKGRSLLGLKQLLTINQGVHITYFKVI